MKPPIWIDADIHAFHHSTPIHFAHHESVDQPDSHTLHLNDYIEIYVYVSGNHHYIVENSLYRLHRGDIMVINPREVHKALPLSACPYERFYFLVDAHTFDSMAINPLEPILYKSMEAGNLLSMGDKVDEILALLYAISDCFKNGRNDQLRAFSRFLQFLDEIDRRMKDGQAQNGMTTHTPELLKSILAYVADHTAEIQSTSEIARALGVSPQYLSSYFSKQIGTPLKTFIQAKRIALAKDLLEQNYDVTQACYDCGFNDCSYFIRIFKKYVGITPMIYKRSFLEGFKAPER